MNRETKLSILGSVAFEKKFIPGPNAYESRGKGMSQIIKETAKEFKKYEAPKYPKSLIKVKKNNVPGPTSYIFEGTFDARLSHKDSMPA